MPLPHIGRLIKAEFDRQPKTHTVQWFADQLHCSRPNAYSLFRRESIDTAMLYRVSLVLHHDFFADLSRAAALDLQQDAGDEAPS